MMIMTVNIDEKLSLTNITLPFTSCNGKKIMQGIGNLVGIKEQAETKAMFDNCFQEQFSVF